MCLSEVKHLLTTLFTSTHNICTFFLLFTQRVFTFLSHRDLYRMIFSHRACNNTAIVLINKCFNRLSLTDHECQLDSILIERSETRQNANDCTNDCEAGEIADDCASRSRFFFIFAVVWRVDTAVSTSAFPRWWSRVVCFATACSMHVWNQNYYNLCKISSETVSHQQFDWLTIWNLKKKHEKFCFAHRKY